MFKTIEEFAAEWNNEAAATQKVFAALTDASLQQKIAVNHRDLGRISWHIVTTCHEMMTRTGLAFDAPSPEEPTPTSAQRIADGFAEASQALLEAIRKQWSNASLQEEHNLYGDLWSNACTLRALISHLIHHRGQMTVLMRQAGIVIPDVYGPTLEQWSQIGMEPPEL